MRSLLLLAILLAGCAKGADADLQSIKQARSLGAEWALVNAQAAEGKLTRVYVASMHQWLRDQLRTSAESLTQPDSAYGKEMRALLAGADDADPREINAHVDRLKQIEDSLESA